LQVATHFLSSWWRWHSALVALALVLAALSSCMGRGAVELVAYFSSWRPQSRTAGSIESGLLSDPCVRAMQGLLNAAAASTGVWSWHLLFDICKFDTVF
jgi:hypothetical protein